VKFKAYKFKLEPNEIQKDFINKTIGCSRLIYNCMLYEKQEKYKNEDESKCKTEKEYKLEYEFLKDVDSIALQQARIDLRKAYKNFFRKLKNKQKTSIKYKSKKNPKNSYRTINVNNSIRIKDSYIKLPKLGFVKLKKSREVQGKIKSVTITKNILNQYYVSILCEVEIKSLVKINKNLGIDLGIKDFAITSNGEKISNPKYFRKLENKLTKAQRKLSQRKKGSNRKFKQRQKVFKIHQKIANKRSDFLHKLSTKLINENQVICLEDLSVKNMVKNHCLAKSISDASWSKFVEMLVYKANWYGREIVKIDKFFASSKLCNKCGWKKKDLTLKDRVWTCEACHTKHDRDLNASLNVLDEGLRILSGRDDRDSSANKQTLVCCS